MTPDEGSSPAGASATRPIAAAAAAPAGVAVLVGRGAVTGGRRRWGAELGAVTAELAVGLIGVVLALAAVLSTGAVAQAQVAATAAAGTGARALARGDDPGAALAAAAERAGEGSRASWSTAGPDTVVVSVERRLGLLLPGAPAVTVRARATALAEQVGG